jgi:NDP-sugar pyrophosphorylase family protein
MATLEGPPKPLLEVGGVPMVERLLRQLVDAGVRAVTVITGWKAEIVEAHIRGLRDLPDDLDVGFIRELRPRGNIGSLADLPRDGKTVVLTFGDLVTDLDFAALIERHRSWGADATLTSHYELHRLELGELHVEGDDVTGYQEKPEKQFLICSGIAALEPRVIDLIPRDRPAGISDVVLVAISRGLRVTHWLHGAFWMDVNSPEALERARRAAGAS